MCSCPSIIRARPLGLCDRLSDWLLLSSIEHILLYNLSKTIRSLRPFESLYNSSKTIRSLQPFEDPETLVFRRVPLPHISAFKLQYFYRILSPWRMKRTVRKPFISAEIDHLRDPYQRAVKYKTSCFHVFNVLELDGLLLVNCESLITYEFVLQPGLLLFLPIGFYTILNEYLPFDLLFLRIWHYTWRRVS